MLSRRAQKALRGDVNTANGAKNVRPAADPLPGGAGRPKFTQSGEDRLMQFRVIVVTDPVTHKQTNRTDYTTLRRRQRAVCIYNAPCPLLAVEKLTLEGVWWLRSRDNVEILRPS